MYIDVTEEFHTWILPINVNCLIFQMANKFFIFSIKGRIFNFIYLLWSCVMKTPNTLSGSFVQITFLLGVNFASLFLRILFCKLLFFHS